MVRAWNFIKKKRENKERGKWSPVLVNRLQGRKFN